MTGPAVPPGRCGAQGPNLAAGGPPVFCSLRAGHAGWHEDEGASWTGPVVPAGGQELRKAIKDTLFLYGIRGERLGDLRPGSVADAVLALPEVAALIADHAAVERVREVLRTAPERRIYQSVIYDALAGTS